MSTSTGEPPTIPPDDHAAPQPADLSDPPGQDEQQPDPAPPDTRPLLDFLAKHHPAVLGRPGRWRGDQPQATMGRTGLSREDAVHDALLGLLKAYGKRNASAHIWLTPPFVQKALDNAVASIWRRWHAEHRAGKQVGVNQAPLDQGSAEQTPGDLLNPEALTDAGLRAAVRQHRWHLEELHQQVLDAVFDPDVPSHKAIAERVGRSPSWVTNALHEIASTMMRCILDRDCPNKEAG